MDLRRASRDQRRVELAQAYQAEQLLQAQCQQIVHELEQLRDSVRQAAGPGEVPVDQLLSTHRYTLLVRWKLQSLHERRGQVQGEIERRRQALLEAEKEFRVLEKLKAKLASRDRDRAAKQETRQLDEFAEVAARRKEND